MPLSPQDVHDKQFKLVRQTTGYDMDEVDAFLDEVESEIARLHGLIAEAQQAQAAPATPAPVAAGTSIEANAMAAARILELAQRTADDHVAEATRQGEQIVAEARHRAEAALAVLETERVDVEARLGRLQAQESDIRTRLRGYLETQLRDLLASDPAVGAGEAPVLEPADEQPASSN